MNYILAGILLSIGWHLVKLIYIAFEETLYVRLHKSKWYQIITGKQKLDSKDDSKSIKMKIGF